MPSDVYVHRKFRSAIVQSEFSFGAVWTAKNVKFLRTDSRLKSDCPNAQADLSLRWAHILDGMFVTLRLK